MTLPRYLFAATLCWFVPAAVLAADLSGYWKNEKQAAWIEIVLDNESFTGFVRRNDEKPESVGRVLLKDVHADEKQPATWHGQIYADRLKEFKDATITLPDPDHLQMKVKVGFMSRTVKWVRKPTLPAE